MNSFFWQLSSSVWSWLPRLQSHRGYWQDGLAENSLVAIKKAAALNYEMVEFDVRLTKDKMVILFHDEEIDKKSIRLLTYQQVLSLTLVNTFEEVCFWLSSYENKKFKINVELKTNAIFSCVLEKKVSQIIKHFNLQNQVLISSFNPLALAKMRFYCDKIFRALLLSLEEHPKNHWYLKKMIFNFLAKPHVLNLRYLDWTHSQFKKLSKHIPIVLWTYNKSAGSGSDFKNSKFFEDSFHGIISDNITP